MTKATIAASFARGLMELAVSRGACRAELIERSDIDPANLHDRDTRIPLAKYAALMRAAKELSSDPALALHFAEETDLSEMSVMPMLSNPSGTMAGALAQMNRYAPLDVDVGGLNGDRFQLIAIDGQLWFVDARPDPNDFHELTETAFARMVCMSRRFLGEKSVLKAVHVTHAEPGYRGEYDRVFQMPVVFESDRNALLLSDDAWSTWMANRSPIPSDYVSSIVTAHAETLLERLKSTRSVRRRVESVLLSILHTGHGKMDRVAAKLGLSRQTLLRRLKAEGVTFEKVLHDLRHRMALHYLNDKKLSSNEAAYLVGFSDPAAFSRAFKRWTGSSPRTMRAVKKGQA